MSCFMFTTKLYDKWLKYPQRALMLILDRMCKSVKQ